MKLQSYLLEIDSSVYTDIRTISISKEDAFNIINTKCNDILNYYKNGNHYILRGTKNNNLFLLTDPTKGQPRVSRNTYNYYTLLIDNLSSWKEYPKRSRSIICSTSAYANQFGNKTYIVFPYDNTKIGVCSNDDIFRSWHSLGMRADQFNDQLREILSKILNIKIYKKDYNDWASLKELLIKIDNYKTETEVPVSNKIYIEYIKSGKSMLDYLNDILSPIKNNFELIFSGKSNIAYDREVWIGGPCVLIQRENYEII